MKPYHLNSSSVAFENALARLLEDAKKGPVSVKTCLTILSGRGKVLLLLFIILFFSQIPGIAIFAGSYMCYLGLRIAFNHSWIWLPKTVLNKKIPSVVLKKALVQLLHFFRFMKRWTYSRYLWVTMHPFMKKINGVMIALVGLSLAISPPVPLISFVAYLAVFLMGIGLLNFDGLYMILGYISSMTYFCMVGLSLHYFSITKIIDFFKN